MIDTAAGTGYYDGGRPDKRIFTACQQSDMVENGAKTICRLCGGETTNGTLKVGNGDATIIVAGKPDGFLGVIPYTTSPVIARVCTDCGHIELYARNLQDLLRIDPDTT